jgi:small GTP-binding protein
MNVQANFEILVKVLILGDTSVGKTNFLLRFTEDGFVDNYMATIGFDYKSKILPLDNKMIKLQIWDTAGQERFLSVTKNLFNRVQGIILMFDITQIKTFENVKKWIQSIYENTNDKIPIVLVGNKSDIEDKRQVDTQTAKELAKEYNINYFEASAKENTNVNEVFSDLTRDILKIISEKEQQRNSLRLSNASKDSEKKPKGGCC